MNTHRVLHADRVFAGTIILAFCFAAISTTVEAQLCVASKQGNGAVWANCPNPPSQVVPTQAFVDAIAWCPGSPNCDTADICTVINHAITQGLSSSGGVVDARGVVNSVGLPVACANNPFPQSKNTVPVTVLLPSAKLNIQATWVLPSNTRIVGQGRETQLIATSTFTTDPFSSVLAMVEMGNSNVCPATGCTDIAIEHLYLDGANLNVSGVGLTGIYNNNATDGSYVDDVTFAHIAAVSASQGSLTTGLLIDAGATGSGPYSKITFPGADSTLCSGLTCPQTACVQIRAATRGLHGITCTAASVRSGAPAAAVYLDASNSTIEDAHFEGFHDSIVVGDRQNATVSGNLIWNISGDDGGRGQGTNAIHICNPHSSQQTGACSSNSTSATDVSIFQAQSGKNMTTIEDDLTNTIINSSSSLSYAGMYLLGEPMGVTQSGSLQYSRFTTSLGSTNGSSTTVPTWAVGSTGLGTGSTSCSTPGALYSNINGNGSGGGSSTLYVCSGGSWQQIQNQ
jgi:hypothetical protein